MEMLKAATGANLVHIPYRGSAPAIVDLVAGQIPVASVDITSAYPHIVAGRAIALGMAEAKRSKAAPEIPTIGEGRRARASAAPAASSGCSRRRGTPPAVVKRISAEVREILASPAIAGQREGADRVGGLRGRRPTFAQFLATESARWKQTLQSLNLSK